MDGFINSKIEKQTIYEIYRACRLCGAGAGYKMPIIQNVVHIDGAEVDLKEKIRECLQIEVNITINFHSNIISVIYIYIMFNV